MKIKIDQYELEIDRDMSLLEAARHVGADIPTLCYREGYEHFTSCMLCVVQDKKTGRTLPACSARVMDGMEIETNSEDVRAFRRSTLELLLSDHVGDCEAPCQRLCALHTEIPKIIRDIKAGDTDGAIASLRADMALPGVLERLCHAPCEKGCRRGQIDEGVSIQQLMRHVADEDLRRPNSMLPACAPSTDRRVAIIGGGATGLATAYYLTLHGHACVVFEKLPRVLDRLRRAPTLQTLPDWVVDGEVRLLERMGIDIRLQTPVGRDVTYQGLHESFDAVVLACGHTDADQIAGFGLPVTDKGLKVNPKTMTTPIQGVFAGGSLVKRDLPILKSIQQAKMMAACVSQCLDHQAIRGLADQYNHTMGRLQKSELETFAQNASTSPRVQPVEEASDGFSPDEAKAESDRCLHCDCRANHDCKLRHYADEYGAKQAGFKGDDRAIFTQISRSGGAIYEPGKCVKCGLCVRITHKAGEHFGFTFVGRGFEVHVGASLDKSVEEGLGQVADQVIDACPTGALSHDHTSSAPRLVERKDNPPSHFSNDAP